MRLFLTFWLLGPLAKCTRARHGEANEISVRLLSSGPRSRGRSTGEGHRASSSSGAVTSPAKLPYSPWRASRER
jgi:hypothetical protein